MFNTTIHGSVQGQNVAVASQGNVSQENTAIMADQAMADLRVAIDTLYAALEGQQELQDEIERLLDKIDEAEDQGSKSLMARALSGMGRFALKVAAKTVENGAALSVNEHVQTLLDGLCS